MLRGLVLVAMLGCRINDIDVTGKPCPCPADWFCSATTNTCQRTVDVDAAPIRDSFNPEVGGSTTYRDAVVADAPVSYWRLGDVGATAVDVMGHNNGVYSGTCTHGAAGAIAGDPDPSVDLDGATCKITLPDTLAFPGTASYSVEAWLREPATVSGFDVIFAKNIRNAGGPTDGYSFVDSSTGVYFTRAVGGSAPTTAHTTHALGTYVHVVGVYDGASFMEYVDGVPGPAMADVRAMTTYSANALIGADSAGDFFAGRLDEVAVYDHALSAERIALHHNLGIGN